MQSITASMTSSALTNTITLRTRVQRATSRCTQSRLIFSSHLHILSVGVKTVWPYQFRNSICLSSFIMSDNTIMKKNILMNMSSITDVVVSERDMPWLKACYTSMHVMPRMREKLMNMQPVIVIYNHFFSLCVKRCQPSPLSTNYIRVNMLSCRTSSRSLTIYILHSSGNLSLSSIFLSSSLKY